MEEETCQRITKLIDSTISKDSQLDEFDIVFSIGDINRSPVIHIEHKLGLESWCVKHVYSYAYKRLIESHKQATREEPSQILRWTQFCLLVSPEVTTFWNMRKTLLKKGHLMTSTDLHLTQLVLSRKPKCMEAFQHRRWIFNNFVARSNDDRLHAEFVLQFVLQELPLCCRTAEKQANNYHSWNHRIWAMQQLMDTEIPSEESTRIYRSELDGSRQWLASHVSEHSGVHYHQFVLDSVCSLALRLGVSIERVVVSSANPAALFKEELCLNRALIEDFPDHESLFCLRRYLLRSLQELLTSPLRTASPPPPALKRSCIETLNPEWTQTLLGETSLIDTCKQSHSYQQILGEKHQQWLNSVLAI